MANRLQESTHRKVPQVKHNIHLQQQQQSRARHLVALVPKSGAKSDVDDSDSSDEETQYQHYHRRNSDSSSPPPSLPSSLENLNLLSDDDIEVNQVVTSTSLQLYQQSSPSITAHSPSILSPSQAPISSVTSLSNQVFMPLSPLATSSQVLSPQADKPAPRTGNLICYEQVPSPMYAPSPSAATRSKRPRVIITRRKVVPLKRLTPNWRCIKFTGSAEVEDNFYQTSHLRKSPIEYFKLFFSGDIISLVVEQTNLYSTQVHGTPINITEDDVKDFLAIILLMGIAKLPAYTGYWSKGLQYEKVAEIMSLKKFQLIRRYLHFNDNLKDDGDRYYKIRPLLQMIRENCLQVEEESRFSCDEMMVPHKGTRAGS